MTIGSDDEVQRTVDEPQPDHQAADSRGDVSRRLQALVVHRTVIGPPVDMAGCTTRVDAHGEERSCSSVETRA